MTLTFASVMGAPVAPRPSRQPSHVPPWLVAEARLVRALPAPRRGMIRQLLWSTLMGFGFFAALVSLVVTWACL